MTNKKIPTDEEILNTQVNDWPIANKDMLWPGEIVLKMMAQSRAAGRAEGAEKERTRWVETSKFLPLRWCGEPNENTARFICEQLVRLVMQNSEAIRSSGGEE